MIQSDRVVLRIRLGQIRLTLLAEEDPSHGKRCMVSGGGWAVSHLERSVPQELRQLVPRLCRAIRRLGPPGCTVEPSAMCRCIDEVVSSIGGSTEPATVLPSAVRPPLWPATLRNGRPQGHRLFPFDPELAALRAGRRRLIKREALDPREEQSTTQWLEAASLVVRTAGEPDAEGRRPVFGALDEKLLTDAVEAERAIGTAGDAEAVHFLGRALGYPDCCVNAFVALGPRDDWVLLAARLPSLDAGPLDPRLLWACAPLALLSHVPCTPTCRASFDLADSTLAQLELERPGFRTSWEVLARRVHLLDSEGRSWSIDADGESGSLVVRAAVEFRVPRRTDLGDLTREASELVGTAMVRAGTELLRADEPRWRAVAVADHRARM